MKISKLRLDFEDKLKGLYTSSEAIRLFLMGMEDLLGIDAAHYRMYPNAHLTEAQTNQMMGYLQGLTAGKPYQHLIGKVHFATLKLNVGPQALIPRPETEELAYLIKEENEKSQGLKILDIGTGTGCLALACAYFFKESEVTAIDVSEDALALAKRNAAHNGLQVNFKRCNILEAGQWPNGQWDMIVSNPPYIGESEAGQMDSLVKDHEPPLALFAPGEDVLIFYKMILELALPRLKKGGKVYLEINQKWGPETLKLYTDAGFDARLLKDLSGNDRFVVAEK